MTETKKRKPGRPKAKEPYRSVSFTLRKELFDGVVEQALRERCTRGEIVLRSVRFYLDNELVVKERDLESKIKAIAEILASEE